MITTKQRAKLRAMANGLDTIGQIGKGGITENVVKQAADALKARSIIKFRVLETSPVSAREACETLCGLTGGDPVQVIGTRFVIYKEDPENPILD